MLGEVLTGAEGAAGAGQHDGTHALVVADLCEGGEQLGLQRRGQGVAAVGSVEGDRGDRSGPFDHEDRRRPTSIGHVGIL